jgi:hypothetical protein
MKLCYKKAWFTFIHNLSFTHMNFLCIESTLFVIELCYFGEQMCLDNTGGTDMRVSTRRKTHKQKQLNYDPS